MKKRIFQILPPNVGNNHEKKYSNRVTNEAPYFVGQFSLFNLNGHKIVCFTVSFFLFAS